MCFNGDSEMVIVSRSNGRAHWFPCKSARVYRPVRWVQHRGDTDEEPMFREHLENGKCIDLSTLVPMVATSKTPHQSRQDATASHVTFAVIRCTMHRICCPPPYLCKLSCSSRNVHQAINRYSQCATSRGAPKGAQTTPAARKPFFPLLGASAALPYRAPRFSSWAPCGVVVVTPR